MCKTKCSRVAQLVKQSTLGFGSGRDLTMLRSSPMSGSVLTTWGLLGILSLSLSLSAPPLFSLSVSK